MASRSSQLAQILLFDPQEEPVVRATADMAKGPEGVEEPAHESKYPSRSPRNSLPDCPVVLSGTFRKDLSGLKEDFEEFRDLGCQILSPLNVDVVREDSGFVFMKGEETSSPEALELKHLEAIQAARFVWFHAPSGYAGPTGSLEIGFARANGIPVYSRTAPSDKILAGFVEVVDSPADVVAKIASHAVPPPRPAVQAFQNYYRRAATQRGYELESARDCLLLMVEEVGELARALRKRTGIVRHGSTITESEAAELSDVFIYIVHMANILDIDLSQAVQHKERLNIERFLNRV